MIIPTLNEAKNIPLLIADLQLWEGNLDIIIVDANSDDKISLLSKLAGANFIQSAYANRGFQLKNGAFNAKEKWLLFIHADSRLPKNWYKRVNEIISSENAKEIAWYFDFKVDGSRLDFRLLELAVNIRSKILNKPYGDQGLLINYSLYNTSGGYNDLNLMEDIDIINRISIKGKIKSINTPLFTNGRKWDGINILRQALKNAKLRDRWEKGECPQKLADEYYSKSK